MRKFIFSLLLFCLTTGADAQTKPAVKFGKITNADFTVSSPVVDSNSNAVVLADIGSTEFEGNNNGDFTLVFVQHRRILLRNRNAFGAATIEVPLYNGGATALTEKFENFEAYTYNLENGKVVATKLEKSAVLTEKASRYTTTRKFTFPGIKEGSIIEYRFEVRSPFYTNLRSWRFQGEYPCLWSEYKVTIPPMFDYLRTQQGYIPYTIDTVSKVFKSYSISEQNLNTQRTENFNINGEATMAWWAIKDVPAFRAESYSTVSRNLMSRIAFQLRSIRFSDTYTRHYVKSWASTAEDLLKDPDFGEQLTKDNSWLDEPVKLLGKEADKISQIRKTYEYVRDNFICTDHDNQYLSQSLKKTFQTKSGNVADLNLLLTAIFLKSGMKATPVLLSTRDNGYADETTPILSQYNYVLCRVITDDKPVLLDASHRRLGFGKLHPSVYNRSGRLIDPNMPMLVSLLPDSVRETKVTNIFMINNEEGGIQGAFSSRTGYQESMNIRDKIAAGKKESFLADIAKSYPAEVEISNIELDSLNVYDEPVLIKYNMNIKMAGDEDIFYFSPMFSESWKKNPFSAAERLYPVEMPYLMDELYLLTMDVPKGYKVDELPKSVRVKLNEKDGMFEYIVRVQEDKIQLRSRIKIDVSAFPAEDYETLRDFFGMVVTKQAEQIVFKKVK
ncbi:DUF3858 domain-containing protein [Sediminibacterium ginsengisoli]|uniref:DUF3857 domain-containing protein n=1 Tax=Sediminibacterium ginsengisoli TaxID=413434 RepID=A0A1T4QHU9_9BACT|nr:DUF3858 domain-containing protein [Sediminibacterium ginsengisoli]SKA03274.1 protein of unknown function [Sediminibacterium ginsengisoli]